MDWDLAIKRNSEALKGIALRPLFAMLGLDGEATVSRIPKSLHSAVLARAAARRIRRAPPDCHCGPEPCGEACSFAAHAEGADDRKGWRKQAPLLPALRSAETSRTAPPRVRNSREAMPRASISSDLIPGWTPCFQHPACGRTPPPPDGLVNARRLHRRLQALKLALEDLPRQARRYGPLASRGGKPRHGRSPHHRSGPAIRPATAGSPFTRSMKSSSNATGLPGRR